MTYKLSYIGKLYKEHLPVLTKSHYVLKQNKYSADSQKELILKKASSKSLIVFSKLTSLMESQFAQNNHKIILTTTEISNRIAEGKLISGRMVKRQIDFLHEAIPQLINLTSYRNKSYIQIEIPKNRNGFINVFGLQDSENNHVQDASLDLMLSFLLDKAAFNFRCGYGFLVEPSQIKSLKTELNLTEKTILSLLTKLKELNLITVDSNNSSDEKKKKKDLLKKELHFDSSIFCQFKNFIRLEQTEKCLEIKEKRKKEKFAIQKISENENPHLQKTEEHNQQNYEKSETQISVKPLTQAELNQKYLEEGERNLKQLLALFPKKSSQQTNFPPGRNYCKEKYGYPVGKRSTWHTEIYGQGLGKRSLPI